MLSARQIRAARAFLGWSQTDLAEAAELSLPTIQRIEQKAGPGRTAAANLASLQKAMEDAGILFIEADDQHGPGVRLRDPGTQ